MYSRDLIWPQGKSFFLFGPRGTGKSVWVKTSFPGALYFDLLEATTFQELLSAPDLLDRRIPPHFSDWVIIDEVQKIPALLDEVHRLIENRRLKFILTGSSARKLKRSGVNLLAGRALVKEMHPLTAQELGADFDIGHSLKFGQLPSAYVDPHPKEFLESYVSMYLKEEILQEGITRNLGAFSRFLESASFSQGAILNISSVARDCGVERKTVEGYFSVLQDLWLGVHIPVFTRRAKRKLMSHPKFYFFDTGVFRALRPRGPLEQEETLEGAAFETLVLQELRAHNANQHLEYQIYYFRTNQGVEVDFVLYGPRGLWAFEVKSSTRIRNEDFKGLHLFLEDYPEAKVKIIYAGHRRYWEGNIEVIPISTFCTSLPDLLL